MKQIILDTNFLLIPYQFKVDIFSEIERIAEFRYQLCVLDKTLDELNKIVEEQPGKHKLAAKLALTLLKAKKLKTIKTKEGAVDNLLVDLAKKGAVIATQDIGLKQRLKEVKAKIITLRQKSHLILL